MTYEDEIKIQRKKIDDLDEKILVKIAERMKIAQDVGKIKKEHGKQSLDEDREKEIIKKIRKMAELQELDSKKIERIFNEIINLCRNSE